MAAEPLTGPVGTAQALHVLSPMLHLGHLTPLMPGTSRDHRAGEQQTCHPWKPCLGPVKVFSLKRVPSVEH